MASAPLYFFGDQHLLWRMYAKRRRSKPKEDFPSINKDFVTSSGRKIVKAIQEKIDEIVGYAKTKTGRLGTKTAWDNCLWVDKFVELFWLHTALEHSANEIAAKIAIERMKNRYYFIHSAQWTEKDKDDGEIPGVETTDKLSDITPKDMMGIFKDFVQLEPRPLYAAVNIPNTVAGGREYSLMTACAEHEFDSQKEGIEKDCTEPYNKRGIWSQVDKTIISNIQEMLRRFEITTYYKGFEDNWKDRIALCSPEDADNSLSVDDIYHDPAMDIPKFARSGYYNDDSFRSRHDEDIHSQHLLPLYDRNHYRPVISGEYGSAHGYGSTLLIGGVVGASSVAVIMFIFCLGVACGMIVYGWFMKKKGLDEKQTKEEMHWIVDGNNADV
eukprot:527790_1